MCQCQQHAMETEEHSAKSAHRKRLEICISGSQHTASRISLLQKRLQSWD